MTLSQIRPAADRLDLCMPTERTQKVGALPQDEQDAIASQILASLADEEVWRKRFAEKRDVIRRMVRETLEEDARGETLPLDHLL